MARYVECIFSETTAENSPGIDFDENKYDLKIYIYGNIIQRGILQLKNNYNM